MKTMSIVVCLLFATCEGIRAEDVAPIDTLVKKLDASSGIWLNGGSPEINLPSNAAPKEVIAEAVRKQPFDEGHTGCRKPAEIMQLPTAQTQVVTQRVWTSMSTGSRSNVLAALQQMKGEQDHESVLCSDAIEVLMSEIARRTNETAKAVLRERMDGVTVMMHKHEARSAALQISLEELNTNQAPESTR